MNKQAKKRTEKKTSPAESGPIREQQNAATFIEVKAGPYYSRMPFSKAGRDTIKNFLDSLEFGGAETDKQKKRHMPADE